MVILSHDSCEAGAIHTKEYTKKLNMEWVLAVSVYEGGKKLGSNFESEKFIACGSLVL